MKALGIVVEYNPFHNGHAHHIAQAKKDTNADVVIAVMSGQFLQRGEPAFVDKWYRTKMALASGADIIIELPYVYSTAKATHFAKGAIALLDACGCDSFVFGSEEGNIAPFLNTYQLIKTHQESYNAAIHSAIKEGNSYPQALQYAYQQLSTQFPNTYVDLAQPNNILGFHYIEAAQNINSTMQAVTIARIGAGYHESIVSDTAIASATGIRKSLNHNSDITSVSTFLPLASMQQLQLWQQQHQQFITWQSLWPLLQFTLVQHTPQQLQHYADVTEGIEFALHKAAKTSANFEQFMQKIKSKRYTWTRLQRMLTHIFVGVTKEMRDTTSTMPSYIRLLGMTAQGQNYINTHKKSFTLPLISRVGKATDSMLQLDCKATEMYALGVALHSNNTIKQDFQMPPVRLP